MNGPVRAPLLHRLEALTAVLDELIVDDIDVASRRQRRNQTRNGVDNQARFAPAFEKRLLGAALIVDIDDQAVPMGDPAVRVTERFSKGLNPSILTIGATKPVDVAVRRSGL